MPSGFQQDINQLQTNFYRVAIDLTGYPTADGNTNGGITPNSADSFSTANLPTTLVKGKQRARGNMRFRNIINRLTGLADCQLLDVTITEANGDAQATALAFTVKFERDAFIALTGAKQGSGTVGNDVQGNAMNTTAKVVKNAVVQGILDQTTASSRVYNGDDGTENQLSITVTAPDTQANVYADVTVTQNTDTTLINS